MAGHYGGNPYDDWKGGTNAPHIARYMLARGWVFPDETVLDAACATGYGSYLLSQVAKGVIGMDTDEGCLEQADARWRYKNDNMKFIHADLDKIEWPDADVLVSIETAEHVNNLDHFIQQAQKHIRKRIIITVPIGGTSYAYKAEGLDMSLPAVECNDFNNIDHVQRLFATNGWWCHTAFQFGYSAFCIFVKEPPTKPKEVVG